MSTGKPIENFGTEAAPVASASPGAILPVLAPFFSSA